MNFLTLVNGLVQRIATIAISTGSADADKIAATNGNGQFDNSLINWASPSTIGNTTPAAINATSGSFSSNISVVGNLFTGSNTGGSIVQNINAAAGNARDLNYQTAGVNIWTQRVNATAQGGSNSGSDYQLIARTDTGGAIDTPIAVVRAAGGLMTLSRPIAALSTLTVSDALSVSKSVAGLFRNTFRNLDTSAPRRCDIAILTGASEGVYIGTQTTGAYIDNRSGGSLFFQTSGSSFLSIDASGNLISTSATGSSNSTQGALVVGAGVGIGGNINVGGNAAVTGTLKIGTSGATITRKLRASTTVNTTIGMGTTYSTTITCTGAQLNDTVDVGPPSNLPAAIMPTAYVSAVNTVTLNLYNANSLGTLINGTFTVSVEG